MPRTTFIIDKIADFYILAVKPNMKYASLISVLNLTHAISVKLQQKCDYCRWLLVHMQLSSILEAPQK